MEEYAYQPRTAALVESFDTVRDLRPSDVPEGASGVGPVDWPAECPGLKTALGAFYAAADDVARDLFVAFARAARLDANADGVVVACGEGALSLELLQRPGKGRVTGAEFAAAVDLSGRRLDSST